MEEARTEVVVKIRDNKTEEIREHRTSLITEDGDPSIYTWEDGNFSCDCNRQLFFLRANNEDEELAGLQCSDGLYSVKVVDAENPKLVYYNELEE